MEERKLWDETHKNSGYNNKIFSLLDSTLVLNKFKSELKLLQNDSIEIIKVLIPGCGSNVNLQICCKEVFGDRVEIYALDWSKEAIALSKAKTDKLGMDVVYLNQSYYDLSFEESFFDIIIVSNAIVSEYNENNIKAIVNLTNLLKTNGRFLGLFPSPFNMLDYALTNSDAKHWLTDGTVNILERRIYEFQYCRQRFFSPLELHLLFKDLKYVVEKFEFFFYDDENFAHQISSLYNINYNAKYCFWGYFINTIKK